MAKNVGSIHELKYSCGWVWHPSSGSGNPSVPAFRSSLSPNPVGSLARSSAPGPPRRRPFATNMTKAANAGSAGGEGGVTRPCPAPGRGLHLQAVCLRPEATPHRPAVLHPRPGAWWSRFEELLVERSTALEVEHLCQHLFWSFHGVHLTVLFFSPSSSSASGAFR